MEDTVEQTIQVPVCCFVIAIGILNCCSVCVSQEKELESAKRKPFVVKLENPSFSTVQATVDIGFIERGKTTIVPLRFESNLGGDVTFKTVVVQCACTGASIPDGIIKMGQSVDGEVGLAVSKNERSLSKIYSMEVKTAGSIDRVLIDLKASISGVVAFSQELYTVSIDSSKLQEEEKITLSLPVIASLDIKLEGIAVSVSGALFEKAGKSITAEYKTLSDPQLMKGAVGSVVVQIQSSAILSDSEYLTVQIEGRSFPSETAQIAIRKKLPVSLIPESLFFSSTDLENIQAIGLIRIAKNLDASSLKVISAKMDNGEELDFTLSVAGSLTARIEFTCSKERASKWKKSTRIIEVLLECDGKQYPVSTRCHFQW
jgi:hypothetical protein